MKAGAFTCERCGASFHRPLSQARRSPPRFCSRTCRRVPTTVKRARTRARQQAWVAANREHVRAYHREYREAHPELIERSAAYYRAHRNELLAQQRLRSVETAARRSAYAKAYRAKHRERLRESAKRRRIENADAIRERARLSRLRNREKKRERDAAYRRANRGKFNASAERAKAKKPALYREHGNRSSANRRARLAGARVESVRPSEIFDRDGYRCHLCGVEVLRRDASLDHLVPIVRGGAHARWNVATAHRRCNQRRGTRQLFASETREEAERYLSAILQRKSA